MRPGHQDFEKLPQGSLCASKSGNQCSKDQRSLLPCHLNALQLDLDEVGAFAIRVPGFCTITPTLNLRILNVQSSLDSAWQVDLCCHHQTMDSDLANWYLGTKSDW